MPRAISHGTGKLDIIAFIRRSQRITPSLRMAMKACHQEAATIDCFLN
jgi:hypothetical protein